MRQEPEVLTALLVDSDEERSERVRQARTRPFCPGRRERIVRKGGRSRGIIGYGLSHCAQRRPVLEIELSCQGFEPRLHPLFVAVVPCGSSVNRVHRVVERFTREPGMVLQLGALVQQLGQVRRNPFDILVDLDQPGLSSAGLLIRLRTPERRRALHQIEEDLQGLWTLDELAVDFGIGVLQLEASFKQSVDHPDFTGQDRLLSLVGTVGLQQLLAGVPGLLRCGRMRRQAPKAIVEVAYNTQNAVDDKHNLIVHTEATNTNDGKALQQAATQAKANLELQKQDKLIVLADKGYHTGAELHQCQSANLITHVA